MPDGWRLGTPLRIFATVATQAYPDGGRDFPDGRPVELAVAGISDLPGGSAFGIHRRVGNRRDFGGSNDWDLAETGVFRSLAGTGSGKSMDFTTD